MIKVHVPGGREISMNIDRFMENIMEQIKEAQLKLGYAKEVIRLYFPTASLCRLLQVQWRNGEELLAALSAEKRFEATALGTIRFARCKDDRIEVCVAPEGAEYVHDNVPDPPFLVSIIELFQKKHDLTIEEICACFARFGKPYVCEKMEPGTDFDYVLYFPEHQPDSWYYCVRTEMGHTIYHRFTEEDYRLLIR